MRFRSRQIAGPKCVGSARVIFRVEGRRGVEDGKCSDRLRLANAHRRQNPECEPEGENEEKNGCCEILARHRSLKVYIERSDSGSENAGVATREDAYQGLPKIVLLAAHFRVDTVVEYLPRSVDVFS